MRIGVLNNLFDFLHLISPEKRDSFAGKLGILTRMNSVCNWRFLQTFAEQLTRCVEIFSPADVTKWVGCVYAQELLTYNVADVRHAAIVLVSVFLHLYKSGARRFYKHLETLEGSRSDFCRYFGPSQRNRRSLIR